MRVEISIAREKFEKLPKKAPIALREEMQKRLSQQYQDVEVIVKQAGSDGLFIVRAPDKDEAKTNIAKILQETWESADDWFF